MNSVTFRFFEICVSSNIFNLFNVVVFNTFKFSCIFATLSTFKLFSTVVLPPIKTFLDIPTPPFTINVPLVILDEFSL